MKKFLQFTKILKQSRGLSLIEVMVAMGLLSAVVFAFLGWVSTFSKGMNNLTEGTDIENAMLRLNASFGDSEEYCKAILGAGPGGPMLTPGSEIDYPSLDFYSRPVANQNLVKSSTGPILAVLQTVDPNQKVSVKKITLKYTSPVLTAAPPPLEIPVLASLQVTFVKSNSVGAPEITRKIPVYAKTTAGRMTYCSLSSNGILMMKDLACKLSIIGYQHWEGPSAAFPNGHCVDDNLVRWVNGVGVKVTCPSGTKVAVSDITTLNMVGMEDEKASLVCRLALPALFTPAPRTYSDGTVDSMPTTVGKKLLDIPTSTCDFDVPTGTDISTVQNSIRCVPTL